MELLNVRAQDGSRKFAALPRRASWRRLREHLAALPGVELGGFLTDGVTEGWLDFAYRAHRFTVNDQFGEYWFFVDDAGAPEHLLRGLVEYCQRLLGDRTM
jgi:hypothetical protein